MRNQDRINLALKVTVSGVYTYVAWAPPGSNQAGAVWQVMRYDETSGAIGQYADGDDNFDNVATDLTTLTYI